MEGTPPQQPTEEELRAQIEEQLRNVRVEDLLVESAASIVNLTVRRIAKPDEQDLEQARIGIEAVRGLVDLVEGEVAGQIRAALSDLQLLYARASRGEPLEGPPEEGAACEPESQPKPRLLSPRARNRASAETLDSRQRLRKHNPLNSPPFFGRPRAGGFLHVIPPKTRPDTNRRILP